MEIEEYAIKAMEALIRYGKMPMSNTKGVADTAWEVAIRMKELEQRVKSVDLAQVGRSLLIDKLVKDLGDTNRKFTIWHDGGEWLVSLEPNSMQNCKTLKEWIEQ